MSKNRAASIRARLKNRSDAAKQDFNLTLTHYGLERLLYRLSVSRHAPNFLLKGALLFKLWYDVPHRPTRDADLLGFGPDDIESVAAAFRDVCVIEVDDGIAFEAGSVKTAEIRKEAGYGGVRVELRATLDGAQLSLQVGELRRGIELIRFRGDAEQATLLEDWLTIVLDQYADNVLAFDADAAQIWGRLRVPNPEHALDKQIAATALIHDLTVVTRDTADFEGTGMRVRNPFGSVTPGR